MTTAAPRHLDGTVRTELGIAGMTCDHCVGHVRAALAELGDVTAEVDLTSASAVVLHPAGVSVVALVQAVEECGYAATLLR